MIVGAERGGVDPQLFNRSYFPTTEGDLNRMRWALAPSEFSVEAW